MTPETLVALATVPAAAVIIAGYALDTAGLRMAPAFLALVAGAGAVAAFGCFREPVEEEGVPASGALTDITLFCVVVAGAFAYLLWLASPSLLPVTDGPDVVHHLQLVHFIQRTQHLPHDQALNAYLLEMMQYTPGSHILAASIAAWSRVDGLRVLLPMAAGFAAVKIGIVFILARRALVSSDRAPIEALAAPLVLFVPAAYALGSFFQFFFFAQVVSETFALAILLWAVTWMRTRQRRYLALTALCGIATFLTWPVWIGPSIAAVVCAIVMTSEPARRLPSALVALLPIAVVAIFYAATHTAAVTIAGGAGSVTVPSVRAFGIGFLTLAAAGFALSMRRRPMWPLAGFLLLTILQALGLAALAVRARSPGFYMPFKMVYLMVLPGAVLGAVALAEAGRVLTDHVPRLRSVAAVAPLIVAALLLRGRVPVKPRQSPIALPARDAGSWARGHLPGACVDYFSAHWLTGYWLHLDVLGNPRSSDRMRVETFEFPDVVAKWIQGRGLPYGIVEDLDAVPRDARVDMIPLQRFGGAAVVRNARPAPCHDRSVPIGSLRQ